MTTNLNELFRTVTSLNIDVEAMIKNAENKQEVFDHLSWHIPGGVKLHDTPELSANINELVEILEGKRGIKPSEAPTQPVTEAPTQPVTEAPTQPVTEAPTHKLDDQQSSVMPETNEVTEAPVDGDDE